jgi:hypothetical protein
MNPYTYATNDLAFGAFLIASERLRFRALEMSDPRGRARIIFEDPENIGAELKHKFDNGEAFVEPRGFHFHLRALRKSIDDKAMALRSGSSERAGQVSAPRTQNKGCNPHVNQPHNV